MTKSKIEEVFDALPTVEQLASEEATDQGWGTSAHVFRLHGMSEANVRRNLSRLRVTKRAHIHDWTGGPYSRPVWVQGPGKDAERELITPEQRLEIKEQQRVRERERKRLIRSGEAPPQEGQALVRTLSTIARAKAAGQRPWFATLQDVALSRQEGK